MGKRPNVLRRIARAGMHRYHDREYMREENEKRIMHNKTLGLHISWRELRRARAKFGATADEYYFFEFYNKTDQQRDAYLTLLRGDRIVRPLGDVCKPLTIPGSKLLFNALFKEFQRHEWCNPSACDAQEFLDFVSRHGEVIVKPSNMYQGIGVYAFTHKSDQDTLALYEKLRGHSAHVEQIIVQHPKLKALNPTTVNTVRIATYADTDDVHVLAAALRAGVHSNQYTDNMHSGGCACPLDARTGVVTNRAYNNRMERFDVHPISGIRFIGFQVPFWEEALSLVRAAARKAYGYNCHWVGWDVAIMPDGVTLIEGNWRQGTELLQTGSVGLYEKLRTLGQKR